MNARGHRLDHRLGANIAVVAITKNLADELGPKGSVTCMHPGPG